MVRNGLFLLSVVPSPVGGGPSRDNRSVSLPPSILITATTRTLLYCTRLSKTAITDLLTQFLTERGSLQAQHCNCVFKD